MMLSVQNNFGYVISETGPPAVAVSFSSPNTAGNGLIVVAHFTIVWPSIIPSLSVLDARANSYLPVGACSASSSWRGYLAAWYVRSCAGGANAVTVTETLPTGSNSYVLSVAVFEYAGGFGALDTCAWGDGIAQPSISLSLATSVAGDLIFCYSANFGTLATVSLDPSSSGYTTEQTEQINNVATPSYRIIELLAVDKVSYSAGVQSVTLDFTQTMDGVDTLFVAALPLTSAPPAPPAPPTPSPVSGSAAGWPTIF